MPTRPWPKKPGVSSKEPDCVGKTRAMEVWEIVKTICSGRCQQNQARRALSFCLHR